MKTTLRATAIPLLAAALMLTAANHPISPPPAPRKGHLSTPSEAVVIDTFTYPKTEPSETFAPEGWKRLSFPRIRKHTRYGIEGDGGDTCLAAVSSGSASALYRELDMDLKEYPVLAWRWRVDRVLHGGDARTKRGDDYPARVYVTFAYDADRAPLTDRLARRLASAVYGAEPPGTAVNYIWANRLPKGRSLPNPYNDRAAMFAVESGAALAGGWMAETRNVYEDYRAFFGVEPPRVTGIAVMTDTDNTGEEATACYDDIVFKGPAAP
ncbi:MAG: DUF3047 domain-containing protein [Thermodesulfobacteriota bacterium]